LGHDTRVLRAIPLTLSDNYNGFRIVGTSPDYIDLYHAQFADGHAWTAPMQAVAGSLTGLHTGQTFTSTHGFKKDGDDHDAMPYTIVGILKPTGTVLDRLILTDSQSLYEIHNVHHHHHAHDGTKEYEEEEEAPHSHGPDVVNYETTALLLQTRSPQANKYLALELNHITNLMAVSPAEEMSHIMRGIGMGRRTFILLGGGLTILSALMILSALSAALAARQYDIALLRVLGAPPYRMAMTQLWEGAIIGLCGGIAGIAAAHAVAWAVVSNITLLGGLIQPADMLALRPADAALAALGAGTGMLAALLPAWQAGRADIAGILAQGRG
jgi:putative ABC transport system permease protein